MGEKEARDFSPMTSLSSSKRSFTINVQKFRAKYFYLASVAGRSDTERSRTDIGLREGRRNRGKCPASVNNDCSENGGDGKEKQAQILRERERERGNKTDKEEIIRGRAVMALALEWLADVTFHCL